MATAALGRALPKLLPSHIDLVSQRRQMWLVTLSFAVYVLGGPFVSLIHVTSIEARSAGGGMHIRLHALAFGLPLLAAFFGGNPFRGFRITFVGSRILDPLAAMMLIYWAAEGVHGLSVGNGSKYVLSNGFSFSIPMLCYFAIRNIDYPGMIDQLSRMMLRICLWSIVPNVVVTVYAAVFMGFVGAGGVVHLLPVAAAAVAVMKRQHFLSAIMLIGALATILASLKRSVWGGVVIYPIVFLVIIQQSRHVFKFIVAGMMVFALMLAFNDYLPERLSVGAFASRVESIHKETQGFSSGQARQDEFLGIWDETIERGTWTSVLFGRGIGASYTYYMSTTYRLVIYQYRNSHFTPMGWLLRGGFVGMLLNMSFYGCACVAATLAVRNARPEDRLEVGAWAAYFIIAVLLSVTAFSLTPNAATHMALMVVLVRDASQRRASAFGEEAA
jgi:hypothetical protein